MSDTVRLHRLGLLPYRDAWEWQREAAAAVHEGASEALALVEHPHVYTFGRRVRAENLLCTPADAEVIESDRGGDITYHGPGQLVAYPILDLHRRGLGATEYVRLLEETMIRTAAAFGIEAGRVAGRPGVWIRGAKLGAIGVRVSRGVTTHGLAFNVDPDLARFDAIVPCGLSGIEVTSLARELGTAPAHEAVEDALLAGFESIFDCHLETGPRQFFGGYVHTQQLLSSQGEGRAAAGVRSHDPAAIDANSEQAITAVPLGR